MNTLVLGIPNEHQRKVIEDLKRDDKLFDFHPNEKLNKKMKIGSYPQDQVDCNQVSICKHCIVFYILYYTYKSNEAYLITTKNIHLIGLHFGYKQEILDLFHSLKFIDQDSALWFAFSEKSICIEKSQLQIDISLYSIFDQFQILQNSFEVFPHLFSIQDNIKLLNIQIITKFDRVDRNDWNYEILSLNYTGSCDSDLLLCEEFYQEPTNIFIRSNLQNEKVECLQQIYCNLFQSNHTIFYVFLQNMDHKNYILQLTRFFSIIIRFIEILHLYKLNQDIFIIQINISLMAYLRINGKLKTTEEIVFEIVGNKNNKYIIIEKMVLPNQIFDQLIKQFFGERFIEQIEYDINKEYKIEVIESLKDNKIELELMIEEY